jgi:ankyrin repeat protein
MKLVVTYFFLIFLGFGVFAQSRNVFLDRGFWKSNPSIETINQKIDEGHNITELNNNAFDAVVYALLEKVDNATIKYLLTLDGNDVNKITHDGRTYIFWAAYKGNLAMMQHLIDKGARMDIIDSHGYSVMNFAASTGQVNTELFDFCFRYGAQISDLDRNGANALLLSAPFHKDTGLLNYFIDRGMKITHVDYNGNGLFNYAAKGGNLDYLQLLIDRGLPYKGYNDFGGNAVLFAAKGTRGFKNGLNTYQFLKDKGLTINVSGKDAKNPLHFVAAREKDEKLLQFFLDEGVKADAPDVDGNSPFMLAARSNTSEILKMLRSYVNDLNQRNSKGETALSMALRRNTPDVVQFLIEQGADIFQKDDSGNSLAYYWLQSYDADATEDFELKLELLKNAGFKFDSSEGEGHTLYHIAVESNNLTLVKRLSEFDIDINAKNEEGFTALHLAAMKAHNSEILQYLLKQGADKTIPTDFNESVYDLAAENELLLEGKADISFLK